MRRGARLALALVGGAGVDRIQQVRVEQVMTPAPTCLEEGSSLAGALALLLGQRYQSLPVVGARGELLGVVTRSGILAVIAGLAEQRPALPLREALGGGIAPAIEARPLTCAADLPLKEASRLLLRAQAPSALVLKGGALVGILTLQDVVRAMGYGDEPAPTESAHGHVFGPEGLPERAVNEAEEQALRQAARRPPPAR
jgi:CBS domain-containing protein